MAHLTTTETSPEQELSKLLGVASVCAVRTNEATELPDGTLALQLNKSSSYCYGVRSEDLCKLLGVKHRTIRVRTTGEEGRGKKFSLIDMAMIVSGKDSSNASQYVKAVSVQFLEVGEISNFKFTGRGQKETPVANLRTTLLVLLRLKSLSTKVVEIFVRYIGGDPELVRDILQELGITELPDGTLAFPCEQRPMKQRRLSFSQLMQPADDGGIPPVISSAEEDDNDLFNLLGVKYQSLKVRTTGEGRDIKFSLTDVARLMSGKGHHHARRDVDTALSNCSELAHNNVSKFKFPGPGRKTDGTPVADLRTTLLVIFFPGIKVAQKLSTKGVDVFVRYIGGDPEVVKEVLQELGATELPDGTLAFPCEQKRPRKKQRRPLLPADVIAPVAPVQNDEEEELRSTELPGGALSFSCEPRQQLPLLQTAHVIAPGIFSTQNKQSAELCKLLGVRDQEISVRTIGEGRDKKFSLIDVAMLVSGKKSCHAGEDIKKVCGDYEEVIDNIDHFQFDGQGQRPTPITDLRTTVLVVLRLRSKVAQKLSAKVVDIFIRYIGGDPELAKEVLANREFQEQLAVEQPEHPARAFGESVEPSRPPPQIVNIPGMDAGDHAYLFHSGVPGIIKIGRAADVGLRREQIQKDVREIQKEAVVSIAVLWKHCGDVEKHIHRFMVPHKADNMGRHKEYYICDVNTVLKIFPDALAGYQEENAVNFGSCEYERAAKRRRIEAELEESALRADFRRAEDQKEADAKRAEEMKEAEESYTTHPSIWDCERAVFLLARHMQNNCMR